MLFSGFIITISIRIYYFSFLAKTAEQKYYLSLGIACFGMLVHSIFNFNLYQLPIQLLLGFYIGSFLFVSSKSPFYFVPVEKITAVKYYSFVNIISFIFVAFLGSLIGFYHFLNKSKEQGYSQQAISSIRTANVFYPHSGIYESKSAILAMSHLAKISPKYRKNSAIEILKWLNIAIEKNPLNEHNYSNRAKMYIYFEKNKNKKFIKKNFETALKINPYSLDIRTNYARYLDSQQHVTEALDILWGAWGKVYGLSYQEMLVYLKNLENYNILHGNSVNNKTIEKVRDRILDLSSKNLIRPVFFQ